MSTRDGSAEPGLNTLIDQSGVFPVVGEEECLRRWAVGPGSPLAPGRALTARFSSPARQSSSRPVHIWKQLSPAAG